MSRRSDGDDRGRAVVTGMGWVTPHGVGIEPVWEALCAGRSGIGRVSLFDASSFLTQVAAEVDDRLIEDARADLARIGKPGRNTCFAVTAAKVACEDAGLVHAGADPSRVGVYLGSGEGAMDFFNFVTMIGNRWTGERVAGSA